MHMTCYLIDDDAEDHEIFMMALEDIGRPINCVTASDAEEAISRLQQDDTFLPDYIFLDLSMPCINGKECLAEIKKINRVSHIPVVIYSTSMDPHDIAETRQLGAFDYISKIISLSDLTKKLNTLLSDQ